MPDLSTIVPKWADQGSQTVEDFYLKMRCDSLRLHVPNKNWLNFGAQPLLCECRDFWTILHHLLADPSLRVGDFRIRVSHCLCYRIQGRKAHSKAHIVDILFNDVFDCGSRYGWIFEDLEQGFGRECPAFLVFLRKCVRGDEGFNKRNNCGLAVYWTR